MENVVEELKPCIIVDLDGTLADCSHRLHYVRNGNKDWESFFEACDKDKLVKPVRDIMQVFALINVPSIILSGRSSSVEEKTLAWLSRNAVPYHSIMLREEKNYEPDHELKQKMLNTLRQDGFAPILVIDDRPSVVEMWKEEGLFCLQVPSENWEEKRSFKHLEGKRLLVLMVGPSRAGKSSLLEDLRIPKHRILASDKFRKEMTGSALEQSKNREVFRALHEITKARLENGFLTYIDATNIKRKDRLAFVDLAPPGTIVRYFVLDRPLEEKLASPGNVPEDVIKRHHNTFRSQEKDILAGDGRSNVIVVDWRELEDDKE